ncbi:MAG: glycoside hydrolase family 2 TIM barrel-domain containing protein [bacterium]|nr:glycoside hydrolase family 2 TIM barrel-domain containing protein [bacterium]
MIERIYLNEEWMFTKEFTKDLLNEDYKDESLEEVRLPHTNVETPYHYFDEHAYQMVCGYKRVLFGKKEWRGKHVLITFEGAAHLAEVYVNGTLVATHKSGYTAFTVDIAPYLVLEKENQIVVKLDSNETLNIPPFGNVIDYMTYGGMYREVYLEIKEEYYMEDAFVTTEQVLEKEKQVSAKVTLNKELKNGTLVQTIYSKDQTREVSKSTIAVNGKAVEIKTAAIDVALWDTKNPNLYYTKLELFIEEKLVDVKWVRFGFRECEFRLDGFYLNNRKVKIQGLNRHQSYPYVGYAMPKNAQVHDAKILKEELGLNAVRTSHYPQSHYFLDACDELGLLVFTELPGWQHIGDEEWKEEAVNNVREMVMQYRNHTSIIIWGVRINESMDDDAFYTRTNAVAHELDPTRQTGGVRYIKKSNLLEDVYTYNDFLHNGKNNGVDKKKKVTSDMNKPYLVTEYNGHMYPTKAFDCEEHRLEHALRHARVVDGLRADDSISGGFGWCMFDYNTHKDFGSGDRICYHGVLDMFRNPKMASYVYESQQEERDVLYVSSAMDIGEHPASSMGEVYFFTNADKVRAYKNGVFIKEFRKEDSPFKHMAHGPILLDDYIGNQLVENEGFSVKKSDNVKKLLMQVAKTGQSGLPLKTMLTAVKLMTVYGMKMQDAVDLYGKYIGNWGSTVTTYRFEAIKNGKVVKVVEKQPMTKAHLHVTVDHTDLVEESTYDVASIRIEVRDEHENLLPYFQEPVSFQVEGELELIGPNVISLKGGMGGAYVKTKKTNGLGFLTIKTANLDEVRVPFTISGANELR